MSALGVWLCGCCQISSQRPLACWHRKVRMPVAPAGTRVHAGQFSGLPDDRQSGKSHPVLNIPGPPSRPNFLLCGERKWLRTASGARCLEVAGPCPLVGPLSRSGEGAAAAAAWFGKCRVAGFQIQAAPFAGDDELAETCPAPRCAGLGGHQRPERPRRDSGQVAGGAGVSDGMPSSICGGLGEAAANS